MNIKRALYWLPVLLIASIIFYSSSQPYTKQDMRSSITDHVNTKWVEKKASNVKFKYVKEEVSINNLGVGGFIEFFLRKGAHFSVYFALAIFLVRALRFEGITRKKSILFTIGLCCLYAVSDEFHQMLTGDRTPLAQDVMLDTFGASVAMIFTALLWKIRRA